MGTADWEDLIRRVRDGDDDACHDFWNQYGPLIERVARRQLSTAMQRRVATESVTISACRTFFRRARNGEFEIPDEDSVWRLLCAITVNKARMKTRFHLNQKRGLQAEQNLPETGELVANNADPAAEVAFAEQLESIMQGFSPEEAGVLEGKLQRYTNEEIAEKLQLSERTIRRMTKRIQARLKSMFDEPI